MNYNILFYLLTLVVIITILSGKQIAKAFYALV